MAEMSKQDWAEKDKRIVCQNALAHATNLVTGRPSFRDDKDIDSVGLIKEIASELVDWVYEKSSADSGMPQEDSKSLPLPTPEQSAILETFKKKYGIDKAEVYKACGSYPTTKAQAGEVLKTIQGK